MNTAPGDVRALVHPAIGFERVAATGAVWPLGDEELGERWATLTDAEQIAFERRFFTWLLAELTSRGAVLTELDLSTPGDHETFQRALVEQRGVSGEPPLVLDEPAIAVLVTLHPLIIVMQRHGRTVLFLHDFWSGVQVWLPQHELDQMEAFARQQRLLIH